MKKVSGEHMVACYISTIARKEKPTKQEDIAKDRYRSNYYRKYKTMKKYWEFGKVVEMLANGHSIQNGTFREPDIEAGELPGTFRGAQFLNANMFILDIDDGNLSVEDILEKAKPWTPSAIYRTLSYTEEKKKYRVIFLTDGMMNRETYQKVTLYFIDKLDSDTKCKDPGRLYFGGKGLEFYEPNLVSLEVLLSMEEVMNVEVSNHSKKTVTTKTGGTIYEKLDITSEKIFENLKSLKIKDKPEIIERSQSFKFINSLSLADIIGVNEGDHFLCILPNHNDSNPSALILADNRYTCFGCLSGQTHSTKSTLDTLQLITGLDLFELQNKILEALGIQFGSNYQNNAYQTLQYNRSFITADRESRIFKKLKATNKLRFYLDFIQYVENYLPQQPLISGEISLFAAYSHIAVFMLDMEGKKITEEAISNMKSKISRNVRDLSLYGLIKKIEYEKLPKALRERAEEEQRKSGKRYKTTYWYIPKLSLSVIEEALDKMDFEKQYGYTKRVANKVEMLLLHGEEETKEVYNQTNMEYSEEAKRITKCVILHLIGLKGYFTKSEVNAKLPLKEKTVMRYIPGIAMEIGYEQKRINKIYRERYNITEAELKKGSFIYVKGE